MKNFKASIMMVACMLGVTAMQPVARAMLTTMPDGGSFSARLDSFDSYVRDIGNAGEATAGIDDLSFGSGPIEPTVEYTPARPDRCFFGAPAAIIFSDSEIARIFLRMLPNYCVQEIDAGDITFPHYDLTHSIAVGHDLFQNLYTHWVAGQPVAVTISSTEDPTGSNAPVPASTLLLFTGLIGLIGFRRRMMNW